jgi:hypothetical protein
VLFFFGPLDDGMRYFLGMVSKRDRGDVVPVYRLLSPSVSD